MHTLINLVATRSKDGNHAALMRWYNDHVHLLMGFEPLQRATLYRRMADAAPQAPEYTCLYEFASHADFLAFEHSDAREQARQVMQAGWGQNGIEITQRTQYWRLGRRTADAALAGSGAVQHIQCLSLGAGPLGGVARWLADRVHCALELARFTSVAWHRAVDAGASGGEALVLAQTPGADPAGATPLPQGWWQSDPPQAALGHMPATVAIRWQGPYLRLCSWAR